MLFARRAIQRRLNELRWPLGDDAVDSLAARLNRPDDHRLAAVWEAVVLHALSKHGSLKHEAPLASGKRPDVDFAAPELSFIADITATSDDGLHEKNPYQEFSGLIEQLKNRLGLPPGGVDLRVRSREERSSRGTRTVLRLPERRHLPAFIKAEIEPRLRAQLKAGDPVLHIDLDDEKAGVQVTIDPRRSPISTGGYASYDSPTIRDRNPLYKAMDRKVRQLREAEGLKGIIVGDAASSALADRRLGGNETSPQAIAQEFLRRNSSVGFVVLLSVREEGGSTWSRTTPLKRRVHPLLVVREGFSDVEPLTMLVNSIVEEMPKPAEMPINAAHQARAPGYGWGHHGGYQMSRRRIKISSRELMELLAGRRTSEQANELHGWLDPKTQDTRGRRENQFELRLREGRLPTTISVIRTDENDSDDWIEFEFGDPDAAVTPFK